MVLVWHHDEEGAIGLVVNRLLEPTLPEVLALDDELDLSAYRDVRVAWGGPVETSTATVITRGQVSEEEGWPLPEHGLGITRSQEALTQLLQRGEQVLLVLGYAGWGPGQLDSELERGGWLFTDVSADLVFDAPAEARYDLALASLGLTASTVLMQPIDA